MEISEVIHNTPIANTYRNKELKPIGTIRENNKNYLVDALLSDYADLIDQRYTKWFAKRFYTMPFDVIHKAASQARRDGKSPQRLFVHLIKKYT